MIGAVFNRIIFVISGYLMDTYIDKVLKDNMGMKEFKTFWKINSVGYNKCNSK